MRVCFLTHYYPPERGAPQVRISALAAQLAKRGHDSVIHTGFPNYPTGVIPAPYRNRLVAQDRDASGRPVVRSLVYATPNAGFARRVVNHAVFAASAVVTNRSTGPADVVVAETPPLHRCGWRCLRCAQAGASRAHCLRPVAGQRRRPRNAE